MPWFRNAGLDRVPALLELLALSAASCSASAALVRPGPARAPRTSRRRTRPGRSDRRGRGGCLWRTWAWASIIEPRRPSGDPGAARPCHPSSRGASGMTLSLGHNPRRSDMRLVLAFLAGGLLASMAAVSTATGLGPPKPLVAKFHISGYGVYHRTTLGVVARPALRARRVRAAGTRARAATTRPSSGRPSPPGRRSSSTSGPRDDAGRAERLRTAGHPRHRHRHPQGDRERRERRVPGRTGPRRETKVKTPGRCGTWTYRRATT